MEGWRQWQLGGDNIRDQQKTTRTHLTPTGLLMEGDYTTTPVNEIGVGIVIARDPLPRPGRALVSASGSYLR